MSSKKLQWIVISIIFKLEIVKLQIKPYNELYPIWFGLTLKSKRPPLQAKTLNFYKIADKSPIQTNENFLELPGKDIYTYIGLIYEVYLSNFQ